MHTLVETKYTSYTKTESQIWMGMGWYELANAVADIRMYLCTRQMCSQYLVGCNAYDSICVKYKWEVKKICTSEYTYLREFVVSSNLMGM